MLKPRLALNINQHRRQLGYRGLRVFDWQTFLTSQVRDQQRPKSHPAPLPSSASGKRSSRKVMRRMCLLRLRLPHEMWRHPHTRPVPSFEFQRYKASEGDTTRLRHLLFVNGSHPAARLIWVMSRYLKFALSSQSAPSSVHRKGIRQSLHCFSSTFVLVSFLKRCGEVVYRFFARALIVQLK